METGIRQAGAWLAGTRSVAVLTGAGISAESGIPTFRDDPDGLWGRHDPRELATPEAFHRDPELVTRWYDWRRQLIAACSPNAGHRALVDLEDWLDRRGGAFWLLTQNIDELHQRAGSRRVVELHGSIHRWRCSRFGHELRPPAAPFETFPPMSQAGHPLRPGVVWFGEVLPEDALASAFEAIATCDVFVSIGTSSVVWPAAGFAEAARGRGAHTIEINRDPTPITDLVELSILGKAGDVLPALIQVVKGAA